MTDHGAPVQGGQQGVQQVGRQDVQQVDHQGDQQCDEVIPLIIAEFSEVFAFARGRWARFAEDVHPELKGVGMMVLQTILRKGPITTTGLAQMLDMDKAMVSRQVTKLRELGFVEAEAADEDRRVTLLTPSALAKASLDQLHADSAAAYRKRFEGWSEDDLAQLRALLGRFNASAHDGRLDGPARRCAEEHQGGAAAVGSAPVDSTAAGATAAVGSEPA